MTKTNDLECKSCSSRFLGLLGELEKDDIHECSKHKSTTLYKKGQIIFYEGNPSFGLYCIYSGRVKLYKTGVDGRQQIVRIAGPGNLLGYRAIFADEPYHATAETLEDASICCIDKKTFFNILSENQNLAHQMMRKLARELRLAEELATSIAQKSVRERMAELLLMMKKAYGKPTKNGTVIDLQLSREEMAEMIGVTQETAIRLLSEFKKDKMIEVKEREITIINPEALTKTANL